MQPYDKSYTKMYLKQLVKHEFLIIRSHGVLNLFKADRNTQKKTHTLIGCVPANFERKMLGL